MGEVKDIIDAKQIAERHLQERGKVVFGYEIRSIFKKGLAWFVEIESKVFNGVVVIKSATGEVASVIEL
ncbi:MAG: hypothetical protein Q8P40_13805 [Nitrospirota bacterium]|nr:hypothetical protein [Nitrospirota bacterium]